MSNSQQGLLPGSVAQPLLNLPAGHEGSSGTLGAAAFTIPLAATLGGKTVPWVVSWVPWPDVTAFLTQQTQSCSSWSKAPQRLPSTDQS